MKASTTITLITLSGRSTVIWCDGPFNTANNDIRKSMTPLVWARYVLFEAYLILKGDLVGELGALWVFLGEPGGPGEEEED